MGKSPETVPAKVLKNRENKIRRDAARQGVRVVKLHRDGRGKYLLFAGRAMVSRSGAVTTSGHNALTLDEVVSALRDRQHQMPQVSD